MCDGHSPILVLHAAVEAAGIARTRDIGPFLANLDDPAVLDAIRAAAQALRRLPEQAMSVAA
jgi:hypothetical protein